MVDDIKGEKGEIFKKVSFLLEKSKYDTMMGFARERGEKYPVTYVFIEACEEYIQQKDNPHHMADLIRKIVKENPGLLKEEIADQVREQVQIQLRQILGERYRP